MKKFFLFVFLCVGAFVVYQKAEKQESLLFAIGSKEGDIYYDKEDLRIPEVTMNIEQNIEIQERPIQNILIKASKIFIDSNRLFRLSTYENILTQLKDFEELLILLRKYSKEQMEVRLLKGSSEQDIYTNQKISILCKKYDIIISR